MVTESEPPDLLLRFLRSLEVLFLSGSQLPPPESTHRPLGSSQAKAAAAKAPGEATPSATPAASARTMSGIRKVVCLDMMVCPLGAKAPLGGQLGVGLLEVDCGGLG